MSNAAHLPQPKQLHVEQAKVVDYLLNPEHKDGAAKAKFFRKRGFKSDEWQVFRDALTDHGATQFVTKTERTKHGQKFVVECEIKTPDGKNPCILSVWIKLGESPPHLVTAHPNS